MVACRTICERLDWPWPYWRLCWSGGVVPDETLFRFTRGSKNGSLFMTTLPWITILTVVPLVGGLIVLSLPLERKHLARLAGLLISFIALLIAFGLWTGFQTVSGE